MLRSRMFVSKLGIRHNDCHTGRVLGTGIGTGTGTGTGPGTGARVCQSPSALGLTGRAPSDRASRGVWALDEIGHGALGETDHRALAETEQDSPG